MQWNKNPFAFYGERLDSIVSLFTLKVQNLSMPIVLLLPISDLAPWRDLATAAAATANAAGATGTVVAVVVEATALALQWLWVQ